MKSQSPKFDLEERTFTFVRKLPRTLASREDAKQLIRASGSVGANYIEANDALGKKDFRMHLKISPKEAKESRYFLRLMFIGESEGLSEDRNRLIREAVELTQLICAVHLLFAVCLFLAV